MCTYSQLKKIQFLFCATPYVPYVPKLYASSEKISQNVLKVEA